MSDRGGGIPLRKIERLFSYMYSTAPTPQPGTGGTPLVSWLHSSSPRPPEECLSVFWSLPIKLSLVPITRFPAPPRSLHPVGCVMSVSSSGSLLVPPPSPQPAPPYLSVGVYLLLFLSSPCLLSLSTSNYLSRHYSAHQHLCVHSQWNRWG